MSEYDTILGRIASLPPGFILNQVRLDLTVRDVRKMLINHRLKFNLTNKTFLPVNKTPHYIMTDIPKSIEELKLRAYRVGRTRQQLQIESCPIFEEDDLKCTNQEHSGSSFFKYFQVVFLEPLSANESIKYCIEYESEEPERFFSFNYPCDHLAVFIDYPTAGLVFTPSVFEGDVYRGYGKKVFRKQFNIDSQKRARRSIARFTFNNVSIFQSLTFRW